jgi:hypothetical protein
MTDRARLTRRSLLKRAGLIGAAIVAGGVVLERTVLQKDESSSYLSGFNDDFVAYSTSDFAGSVMEKVQAAGGQSVRIGVDWGAVQAEGAQSFDWSPYNALHAQALIAGVQILPTIFGCPAWANPVSTSPETADFPVCSREHDDDFGRFAFATARHFDAPARVRSDLPTVISAVEILNEPNIVTFGAIPAGRLFELSQAAAQAIAAGNESGAFSEPITVVSGGLAPVIPVAPGNAGGFTPRPSWQDYLTEMLAAGSPEFEVGIHSYETAKPPPGTLTEPEDNSSDPYARAGQFAGWQADRIIDRIDQALDLTTRDIWVTETGASSAGIWSKDIFSPGYREAHGQKIQADVLTRVAEALGSRPRCKAMIVHRLFSNDEAEPPPTASEDSVHYQNGVYESIDGKPKLAVAALAEAWG